MRVSIFALLGLVVAGPVLAGEPLTVALGDALLTLTAEGKSTRAPDIAGFSAGITTVGATAGAAMAANAAAMTRVIDALKAAGIADRDVQTSNLSLNPVFDNGEQRDSGRRRITGYQASNNVAVRVRAVGDPGPKIGSVIDALVAAGANEVSGPNFELDQPAAALDEARVAAVASARSRADLYARAAGMKVLRIVSINEGGGNDASMIMVTARRMSAKAAPTPVAAGEIGISVGVTMQFELAPL